MAQLHEYQGKKLLAAQGIATPRGAIAPTADAAHRIAHELGGPVVVKAQVHSTSRAAQGGIRFADTPDAAAHAHAAIIALSFGGASPELVLVEEKQAIAREFYCGYIIDDRAQRPALLFSAAGGSGIEERAATMAQLLCSVRHEPAFDDVKEWLATTDAPAELVDTLADTLIRLYRAAQACEARTLEINPLAQLADGRIVALDSRVSVDDYAAFRHPELGIEIARELGHTPTKLERIAWEIEHDDFRGTFFFVEIQQAAGSRQQAASSQQQKIESQAANSSPQPAEDNEALNFAKSENLNATSDNDSETAHCLLPAAGSNDSETAHCLLPAAGSNDSDAAHCLLSAAGSNDSDAAHCLLPAACYRIGFHGAGGGGSMASMDAALRAGLQPADYVDTSGNPPASKVYRAARIILSIPDIRGYFLSGSGVASQEQFGLARAVLKAFREVRPTIPAVLRLGGNGEDIAAELVTRFAADLPAPVEAYQKRHSADFCAARLHELIEQQESGQWSVVSGQLVSNETQHSALSTQHYSFPTRTGRVVFDHAFFAEHPAQPIVDACAPKILSLNAKGLPVLNITSAEAQRGKCTECLACEVAAWEIGGGAVVELPINGLEEKL